MKESTQNDLLTQHETVQQLVDWLSEGQQALFDLIKSLQSALSESEAENRILKERVEQLLEERTNLQNSYDTAFQTAVKNTVNEIAHTIIQNIQVPTLSSEQSSEPMSSNPPAPEQSVIEPSEIKDSARTE